MIIADTSIWVNHLRGKDVELAAALERGEVLMHPFIVGELACGNLRNRSELLHLLHNLPAAPIATDDEALVFIEQKRLMGRGIGYIDAHLLASAALAGTARLWTADAPLASAAADLELAY